MCVCVCVCVCVYGHPHSPQNHAPHVKIPVIHFQFKEAETTDGRPHCFQNSSPVSHHTHHLSPSLSLSLSLSLSHTHTLSLSLSLSHTHTHTLSLSLPLSLSLSPETRTYIFDAESEKDLKEWRETMQNVQLKLFAGDGGDVVGGGMG